MISPGLRDAAVLRADRRAAVGGDLRPAAGRVRQALVRADQRRRPAVDQRHRDPAVQRRLRRGRRARDRGRAALRRGAGRAPAPAGAAGRRATARAPGGWAGSSSAAATRRRSTPVARAVANSPLVKTALYGGDPNWGRIIQAVGAALPGTAPLPVDVAIEGVQVCAAGPTCPTTRRRWARRWPRDEVEYEIGLPGEGAETEVFFSDLGHEYVTINADYTT